MKNKRIFGKLAAISGFLAVIFSLTLMYSLVDPADPTGPLTRFIGDIIYSPTNQPVESTMQAIDTFSISEDNIQKLLTLLIGLAALASGLLAITASRKEDSSLWYSLAIALSSVALMKLSTAAAILFMFIFGFICIRNRKWKMTLQ